MSRRPRAAIQWADAHVRCRLRRRRDLLNEATGPCSLTRQSAVRAADQLCVSVGMAHWVRMAPAELLKRGKAVQSSRRWTLARALIGAFAAIAVVSCDQRVDALGDSPPMTRDDTHGRQVDFDVAAIAAGMARAHGAKAAAYPPHWWQDLLSHP